MNSNQISSILGRVIGRNRFTGVFASDNLPAHISTFPAYLVVNTDPHNEPGQHWLAIIAHSREKLEYFDPFGEDPPPATTTTTNGIAEFIRRFKNVLVNKIRIQASYEMSCGPHVIYYLSARSRGVPASQIIKQLLSNNYRDTFVKFFVNSLYKKLKNI